MIESFKSQPISMRIIRIWLGVTWIYAGWVKASDAGFLKQGSPTYIGTQLAAYASQSPIGSILNHFVEHAFIVGIFVMLSEFAIGVATLAFVAPSTAALGGLAMSIGLWLSSSFHSSPYFLASDTAYAVLWAAYFFSTIKTNSKRRGSVDVNLDRRGVLRGAAVAAGAVLASIAGKSFAKDVVPMNSAANKAGKKIVKLSTLKVGGSKNFIAASGAPAVLFRTKNGVFAYSAICTHQGCTVDYSTQYKALLCPCHGAMYDPFSNAKVLSGPTNRPLDKVKVAISGDWIVQA
jgi:thiosulfate dehydrogenase [quinone] large subunit